MSGAYGSSQIAGALGQHPRGHLLLPTSFLQNSLHIAIEVRGPAIDVFYIFGGGYCHSTDSAPWGPAIDVFYISGGRNQDYRQHPPGGPSLTSSTSSVVAAAKLRPTIDAFFIFGGGCWSSASTPQGPYHQRLLQLRWWPLLKIPTAPPREPTIDIFFIFGRGCCQTSARTPRGPAIDVFFNFDGGRCRKY
jgi:hypothetical protein